MNKLYIIVCYASMLVAVPLLAADHNEIWPPAKPTQPIQGSETQSQKVITLMFDGTPPLCTKHIEEVEPATHTINANLFRTLQLHALISMKVRLDYLDAVRNTYTKRGDNLNFDEHCEEIDLINAQQSTTDAWRIIGGLSAQCGTDDATITTQDILRCAQWAKKMKSDDNYVDLTFHNWAGFRISCRSMNRDGILGQILCKHELIERTQYNKPTITSKEFMTAVPTKGQQQNMTLLPLDLLLIKNDMQN